MSALWPAEVVKAAGCRWPGHRGAAYHTNYIGSRAPVASKVKRGALRTRLLAKVYSHARARHSLQGLMRKLQLGPNQRPRAPVF